MLFAPNRALQAIAFLAVLLCAGHEAQAAEPTLSPCREIAEDRARLACYDKANLPPAAADQAGVPAPISTAATKQSLIDEAWAFGKDTDRYALRMYRPSYLLPVRYTDAVNQDPFSPIFGAAGVDGELDPLEVRFNLSFKSRIWTTDNRRLGVWFAYTQQSQWQVYNHENSRPFRETNYEPEVFVSYRPDIQLGSFDFRLIKFGYNHQSNGRSQVLSRSWDRLILELGIERDQLAILTRIWYRLPEDEGEDDNPDINRYMGYGDVTGVYKWRGHSFSLMLRGNWNTGKGAARFTWMSPALFGSVRGYVQAFSGYGDSMIDYNWSQNVIGIGVSLNDIL